MKGKHPYLEDLITMVLNHLLTGMILQVWSVVSVGKGFNWAGLRSFKLLV